MTLRSVWLAWKMNKKGKNLFWAIVKIIVWVTFMLLASWFVLYEMLDIFVL